MTFYQCFFIMFLNKRIEKISIIYYVLSHSISRRTHWGNLYHLLCAFSFYFSIFFENTHELNSLLLGKPLSFTMCFLIESGYWGNLYHLLCAFSSDRASRRAHCHWGNPYYLLCASPFYFPAGALGKPLSFTMCFLILFLDFLWKHAWVQPALTGETPIIYYVLPHPIPRFSLKTRMGPTRSYWRNLYHLLCASPLDRVIGETPTIYYVLPHPISRFSLKTRMGPTPSYWGNPYHLLCASPSGSSYSPAGALSLGKPLLFTMCFSILFFGGLDFLWKHAWAQPALTGETPIIYYVLPHRVPRRAHCHWGNLYYLMGASPLDRVIGETSIIYYVLPHWIGLLGKPLLFTMCFPILFSGERLGDTPIIYYVLPHRIVFPGRRIAIGEPSIILYVLPHRDLRRAHCHWGNLYYLVDASPVIDVRGLAPTLIVVGAKPFLGTLGKPLLFSRCFPIIFPDERIGER